jgi:hypothetical protein
MRNDTHCGSFALASCIAAGLMACEPSPPDGNVDVESSQENLYMYKNPWTGGSVHVCFDNFNNETADLAYALEFHLLNTWSRAANIRFWGWDKCKYVSGDESHVAVKFADVDRPSTDGLGMVSHGTRKVTLIKNLSPSSAYHRYQVIHEFGHVLGFAHEQERPDNWDKNGNWIHCDELDNGRKALKGGDYMTPGYDDLSIMNYCVCRYPDCVDGVKTILSGWDIAGAQVIYGVSPIGFKGDLSGDGQTDILWHNGATGATQVWYMHGKTMFDQAPVDPRYSVPDSSGWRLVGTGDLDYDGNTDLLWHNGATGASVVWYMVGATMRDQAPIDPRYPVLDSSGWRFAGTADFNADRKVDLIWHNGVTGATVVWFMNGTKMVSQMQVDPRYPVPDSSGWRFAGTGDFNYDGLDEIVWHNGVTGATQIWFMFAPTMEMVDQVQVDPRYLVPDSTGFALMGIADFNRDQKVDILWHNGKTGVTQVWYMDHWTMANQEQIDPRYLVRDSSGWRPAGN